MLKAGDILCHNYKLLLCIHTCAHVCSNRFYELFITCIICGVFHGDISGVAYTASNYSMVNE